MAEVLLTNVTKIFDKDVYGVKSADIEISDGEFVVLVGPSGCGKSTTLRLIAGLEEITSGDIRIGDRVVNTVPPKDRDIAMVFQNYALYPHMNVYDNMAFGLKLRKYPKEEIKERVDDAADILDMRELLKRKPRALSGGQRQRVALGRAIVRKPSVFLFDEPLSNLDAKLRVQMRTEISKLHNRLGTTMVYVTHDQVEAMTMGDRIVVMKDAEIQQIDTPLGLYENPVNRFVAGFIGSPSMNFIDGNLVDDGGFFLEEGEVRIKLDDDRREVLSEFIGKELTIGVRPEDLHVEESRDSVPLLVEVSETMGNEIFLYLTTGKTVLVARVPTDVRFKDGEKVPVAFKASKIHFFDPANGNRI